ncbi:MAG: YnbE family lipoprotein [Halopseudomonas sp.]|uniref:YnbE family lipoprotein n=1 Tax=Halopseudomonas sp. TaxID=2901191 RepID=UPI0030016776
MHWRGLLMGAASILLVACAGPTVQLAAPSEPININLNVKIEHEIYIKVDKQLDEIFDESSGLF